MLENLGAEIQECYRHALEARRKAEAARNESERDDFLNMERRWLSLARSYELSERLSRITNEHANRLTALHEYRLYVYDKNGQLLGPARPIVADNDDAALGLAASYTDGVDWMLCDGSRIIKEVRRQE